MLTLFGRSEKAVIRVAGQNMISDRPMELIQFNAHADFVAVSFVATIFLIVHQISFDELQSKVVCIFAVANFFDKHFAIAR